MAVSANVPSSTTACPGPYWFEWTNAANILLNASGVNAGITVFTIGLPTSGAGSLLNTQPNTPLAIVALNQANIQGAIGTGMLASTAIANVVITNSTTLTVSAVNAIAATNINANTRFIVFATDGV
jgi:hypothetical protein